MANVFCVYKYKILLVCTNVHEHVSDEIESDKHKWLSIFLLVFVDFLLFCLAIRIDEILFAFYQKCMLYFPFLHIK